MPPIFSDHMVLQRSEKTPVWGRAEAGERVSVTFAGRKGETTAAADGKWRVDLDLSTADPGPFEMIIEASNRQVISDVVVGEVWLAAGQSNMAFALEKSTAAATDIPAAGDPLLRQFKIVPKPELYPGEEYKGAWLVARPDTAGRFSAIAYYFGKKLRTEIGRPVGVINSSMSSTPIESWMSGDALDGDPDLKAAKDRMWSLRDGQPVEGGKLPIPSLVAGSLFHGMIQPLIPCAIAGVIWSQGEANAKRGWQYRTALTLMIDDWRRKWGREDMPFYFCQAANFSPRPTAPGDSGWAELRESQAAVAKGKNVGMVVLIDTEPGGDLHPPNKKDPGERLATLALLGAYEKNLPAFSPVFKSFTIEQDKVRISMDHADGLALRVPADITPGVTGFAICGENRKWVWANAKVDGHDVIVWSDQVPAPVAVRYAWADNPVASLFNGAGLPAGPFRTDDFPVPSQKKKY